MLNPQLNHANSKTNQFCKSLIVPLFFEWESISTLKKKKNQWIREG
jgi:hypothetical protein